MVASTTEAEWHLIACTHQRKHSESLIAIISLHIIAGAQKAELPSLTRLCKLGDLIELNKMA